MENPYFRAQTHLSELQKIHWFSRIGQPIESPDVQQIHSWEEWAGPEQPSIAEMFYRQQALFDRLIEHADSELWSNVHAIVFQQASNRVPYVSSRDTWYGPNAAVSHAQWTAGLMALCLNASHSIPVELEVQWTWFCHGHWPCGWEDFPNGKLIVF